MILSFAPFSEMVTRCNGWRNAPGSCWPVPSTSAPRPWRPKLARTARRFGVTATATSGTADRPSWKTRPARAGRVLFSSRQRRWIERLARRTPKSVGCQLTHWSTRSLARAAVDQEIVPEIQATRIGALLRWAQLQLQDTRAAV